MDCLDNHIKKTNRRVFIAYVLLGGVNDSLEHAKALINLIESRGRYSYLYHVNLVQYNPSALIGSFKRSKSKQVKKFAEVLRNKNISFSYRQSFGERISAACGQLVGRSR